jgi:hypothetical protein
MPLKFWDEAFLTATRLINYLPSKVVGYKTPTELLLHEVPNYSSLRVFGCACWPNLRPFNTKKLKFRSKLCVFLGYSSLHKGFKCLDIPTGRVYVSRDVVFDEELFPFASLHTNVGARLQHEISLLPDHLHSSHHGGVDGIDQYFANDNSDAVPSDVISEQGKSGDEREDAEENCEENGASGAIYQSPGAPPLCDKSGTECKADSPGGADEGNPILLGSSTGVADESSNAVASPHGSLGRTRQPATRGSPGRGTTATVHDGAGSSAHDGSAGDSSESSTPASAADSDTPKPGRKVEFLSLNFLLMVQYDMLIIVPQVNQLAWMKL